jgi:hypothetical protein
MLAQHLCQVVEANTAVITLFLGLLDLRGDAAEETFLKAVLRQIIEADNERCDDDLTDWERSDVSLKRTGSASVASCEVLKELIKTSAHRFGRVLILVDGVNQHHALDKACLDDLFSQIENASLMYAGPSIRLWWHRERCLLNCDSPEADANLQFWAECDACEAYCCETCFRSDQRCCDLYVIA